MFGYPLAEGPLNGVWRQSTVAGPATAGAVQLDWIGPAGTVLAAPDLPLPVPTAAPIRLAQGGLLA